jgi:hypothetical protein
MSFYLNPAQICLIASMHLGILIFNIRNYYPPFTCGALLGVTRSASGKATRPIKPRSVLFGS